MSGIASVPFDSRPGDIIRHVERDGGVIVNDFFDAASLTAINRELDDAVTRHPPGARTGAPHLRTFHGLQTKRFTRLFEISPTFRRVLDDELVKAYADHFLLDAAGPYWLNSAQAIVRGPGETLQSFHRDNGNWPLFADLQKQLPQATVSLMFAMTDFTEETGATRVVPGSHLPENYDREPDFRDAVPVTMPAGSVFMYLGSTLHADGAASFSPSAWVGWCRRRRRSCSTRWSWCANSRRAPGNCSASRATNPDAGAADACGTSTTKTWALSSAWMKFGDRLCISARRRRPPAGNT